MKYLLHEDLQTPENGFAYFGPFSDDEIDERANDAYAELLAGVGNLDDVDLTDKEAAKIYINPREFWMEQLSQLGVEENH